MKKDDNIILLEPVVAIGSFGAEYLRKGTLGVFICENENMAEITIRQDLFYVPLPSIALAIDAAA